MAFVASRASGSGRDTKNGWQSTGKWPSCYLPMLLPNSSLLSFMVVPFLEPQGEVDQTDRHPLLKVITGVDVASTSFSHDGDHNDGGELHFEDGPSTSTQPPTSRSSSSLPPVSNSRNVSLIRRGDNDGRWRRSLLNSSLWISIEFVVNVSQIIAAIVVLSLSRHEHPQAPLFAWIICDTLGCIATLPHLYWRYIHRNDHGSEQETEH